jgi:hypothetical protein
MEKVAARTPATVRAGPWTRRVLPSLALAGGFILALAVASRLLWTESDLDLFRWPMAELALHGHPLLVYSVHAGAWRSDNGPLSLLPLIPVAALANLLGWSPNAPLRDALAIALLGGGASLIFAREALAAIRRARGTPLPRPLGAVALFLLAPPLLIALVGCGHLELSLELWLLLLTVRLLTRGRTRSAGVLFGLALLTRTPALLAGLPLVLILLNTHQVRRAVTFLGTAAVTAALGFLPFLLANAHDLIWSMVGYRGQVPSLAGSLWSLLPGEAGQLVQHDDAVLFGGAALLLTCLAIRRGRVTDLGSPQVYALMAISTACLPLFAKSVWAYYLVEPCAFATIWWLSSPGRLRGAQYVPQLLAVAAIALVAGVDPAGASVAALATVAAVALMFWHLPSPGDEANDPVTVVTVSSSS